MDGHHGTSLVQVPQQALLSFWLTPPKYREGGWEMTYVYLYQSL